jgi:hypothetical protein
MNILRNKRFKCRIDHAMPGEQALTRKRLGPYFDPKVPSTALTSGMAGVGGAVVDDRKLGNPKARAQGRLDAIDSSTHGST